MISAGVGVPRWLGIVALVGALFVLVPLAGLAARVNWMEFWGLVSSESAVAAMLLSLRTSTAATGLCVVLGVPMAVFLARTSFRGQSFARALILVPLALPPVIGGIALLSTFGRQGLLGHALTVAGVRVAFSTAAVVLAQSFVALPFLVLSLESGLRVAGDRFESVGATLGAGPTAVLFRITLPLVLPALLTGAVLSFARALGEFGATLAFAGSLQGVTRTLPLEIYLRRESDPDAAVALSLLLVVVSLVVVALTLRTAPGSLPLRSRKP